MPNVVPIINYFFGIYTAVSQTVELGILKKVLCGFSFSFVNVKLSGSRMEMLSIIMKRNQTYIKHMRLKSGGMKAEVRHLLSGCLSRPGVCACCIASLPVCVCNDVLH